MAFAKLLTLAAMITVLPLTLMTEAAPTCLCVQGPVCSGFATSDVVLRATVLENTIPTYILDVKTIYKGEPILKHGGNFVRGRRTIRTTVSCGTLSVHGDYLIGLSQSDDGSFEASWCRLAKLWSRVTHKERVSLRHGCTEDRCGGSCTEFQECRIRSGRSPRDDYCADVCDPSPCDDGERCTLKKQVPCKRAPCPVSAVCSGSKP